VGATLSPFNAFLLLQGLETLPLRMDEHVSNAHKVAKWLNDDPRVDWVAYADLDDSPYRSLAAKYLPKGAGAIFTFGVKGGRKAGQKFIEGLELISHLANVGAAGVGGDMVRLSIGLEDVEDIIWDLDQALG